MAFIEKQDPVILNIKLTSEGRKQLSKGNLNFKYFKLGDSEIDYDFIERSKKIDNNFDTNEISILRPIDINPSQISCILRDSASDALNEIDSIPENPYMVQNKINDLGFFNISNNEITIKTDINHIKQPDLMIETSAILGGKQLNLMESPNYGSRLEKPEIGDYLLVRWSTEEDTIDYKISDTEIPLIYKIKNVVGNQVEVDRELPNFSGNTSHHNNGVMVMYNTINFSGDTVFNMTSTEYYDESVLSFLTNSQSPTIVYPHWNLTIIHTEDIAGIKDSGVRFPNFNSSSMGGFVSYIQSRNVLDEDKIKSEIEKRNLYEGSFDFSGGKWKNSGTNLLKGTKDFSGDWTNLGQWTQNETYMGFTVMRRSSSWKALYQQISVKNGEKYVISFYARKQSTAGPVFMNCATTSVIERGIATGYSGVPIDNSENWQKIVVHINVIADGTIVAPALGLSSGGHWVEICGLKLERGNKATDWSPAPEDDDNFMKVGDWVKLENKFKGMDVLRMEGTKYWSGLHQQIDVVAGEKYVFSAWVRVGANDIVQFHTKDNVTTNTDINLNINKNEEWERVSIPFEVILDGTIEAKIQRRSTSLNDGWMEVCGITLERGNIPVYWGAEPQKYPNIGVIHYTNQSPANVYGEGFYKNKAKIELPLIRVADKSTIGLTLKPIGLEKALQGLDIMYYDIGYTNNKNEEVIVGKMFHDMKIFVIENQELLYALSYKSNRSWTLPNYELDYK